MKKIIGYKFRSLFLGGLMVWSTILTTGAYDITIFYDDGTSKTI